MNIIPIPGLPLYGVRADGTVWSKKRKGPGRNAEAAEWKQLKPYKNKRTHYLYVCLQQGDKENTFLVHRLVALTFHGLCPEGYEVNHKDTDKDNNSADNLENITQLANLQHAWGNNLIVIGKPKLTTHQVGDIRYMQSRGENDAEIARAYGVYTTTIRDIRVGKTWKHLHHTEERVALSAA